MKCIVCGTENQEGAPYCSACGSPLNSAQSQPGMQQQMPGGQFAQPNMQQQVPNGQFGQPNMQQQMPNGQFSQPNMQQQMPGGQFAQPNMQQQMPGGQFAQPNMQQQMPNGQFGQPMMQQAPYGQPGMPNMNGYGQPPKPKKPLSKGAKIGIIAGLSAALLIGIFFIFIFPILTRAKLKGSYSYKGSYYTSYYVFDDGVYVGYDIDEGETEKDYYYIGTYTYKDGKITMTSIDGETQTFKFDDDDNVVTSDWGIKYKSKDKKAKLDFDIDKAYLDGLEAKFKTASEEALKDETAYEEATYWNSYYIYGSDLKDPYSDFEEALAKAIGYDSDKTLQFLLENYLISVDISISSSGVVTVEMD